MKKSLLIISFIISMMSLLLCGCAGDDTDYVTVTDANFSKTLPVVTVTRTTIDSEAIIVDEEALLAKVKGTTDGVIDIPDIGQFYYEKFTDGIILQGITFIDYYALSVADGTTFTGPINYWIQFDFVDGTTEYLSNVGLLFYEGVHINFKQADNGTLAGAMMLTYQESGSMVNTVYVLAAIAD
ncbi:MAG: hypothetical protein PHD14_00975 [Dehalococcoidales bacterium]|jgi:hypothetical protein|nr:hypothetical protein [Dehalococcoidales bacterium]NLT28806.1 hypothetical protein [Dehalococcoidales bacterium]